MSVIPLEFEARCGEAVVRGLRKPDGWALHIIVAGDREPRQGWAATYEEAVDASEKLARLVDAAFGIDAECQKRSDAGWAIVYEMTAAQRAKKPASS